MISTVTVYANHSKFSATKSNAPYFVFISLDSSMSCDFNSVAFFLSLSFFLFFFGSIISREIIVCWYLSSIFASVCWFVPLLDSFVWLVWGAAKFDCIYHHNHVTPEQHPFLLFFKWWSLPFVILEIHKRCMFAIILGSILPWHGRPPNKTFRTFRISTSIDRLNINWRIIDSSWTGSILVFRYARFELCKSKFCKYHFQCVWHTKCTHKTTTFNRWPFDCLFILEFSFVCKVLEHWQ